MRSLDEIAETGAAWVTETELAALIGLARQWEVRPGTDAETLYERAREEWDALGLMSYTGERPDLCAEDIAQVRDLIRDLAQVLPRQELLDFLEASVDVWREVDRLSAEPDGYRGLDASTELRQREREAWERYRDALWPDSGPETSES